LIVLVPFLISRVWYAHLFSCHSDDNFSQVSTQGVEGEKFVDDQVSVQFMQDHLSDMTREYRQIRDNLAAERCMRRDAEKALSAAAADAAAANTAPVQGLLDALHAARADAQATKNNNRELRQQIAALGHGALPHGNDSSATSLAARRSQSARLGARGSSSGGAMVGDAEGEIAARDEALVDAVQEAAELRRQLRAANAARGEVECLEREIAALTREVEAGAAAQQDVVRLEREVGDLRWQLERSAEEQEEIQTLREELRDLKGSSAQDESEMQGMNQRLEELQGRLNVAEVCCVFARSHCMLTQGSMQWDICTGYVPYRDISSAYICPCNIL
jgi:chromosome segregation ATPase